MLSTRVLLTCAAIGVATGILGGIAGWVTPVVIAGLPIVYGLVLGAHALPGIIAQEAMRMPWTALLAHLIAALVSSAMAPQWTFRFLGTALLFGGIQELVAAAVRYRSWAPWRFFISGVLIGGAVAVAVFFAANLATLAPAMQAVYLVLAVLGPVAWTGFGLWVGRGLRRAGVARPTVR
jgi:energy-coupling factor transport system substrate-specific component